MTAIRIGFVMEAALGHVTHAHGVRHWVGQDRDIDAHWMMIPHRSQDVLERVPALPFSWKMSLRAKSAMRQVLAAQPLDCLYLHTQTLALFSLGLMRRIPTVVSLDATPKDFTSMAAAYGWTPRKGYANRLKNEWFRRVFAVAKGLVGISSWVKESLVRDYGIDADKVKVFPFGVDMQQWPFLSRERARGQRLRLLFVGGDFRRKGGPELLQAFQQGLSHFCELDIVSNEPVSPGELVRVHAGLTPNCAPLKQLYADADVFVMPTLGDATPLAVLEAMASGMPVVTTCTGALHEIVTDGVNGCVVPPGSPEAIVRAVTALAEDRARLARMGQAARATVEQKFNAETNCKGLIAYLKEVSGLRSDEATRR